MPARYVLACDVYGTFLDTSGAAAAVSKQLPLLASVVPQKSAQITAAWRKYQLECAFRFVYHVSCAR
jgi:hypothetical protein